MSGFIADNLLEKQCALLFFFTRVQPNIFFSAQWETNMLKGYSVIFILYIYFFLMRPYIYIFECVNVSY